MQFQFTPLREGRPDRWRFSAPLPNFNSRPSARGDVAVCAMLQVPPLFQFTPLREGRHCGAYKKEENLIFQFTPLREGRHGVRLVLAVRPISIHAPPRGATSWPARRSASASFQFTPLREGRLFVLKNRAMVEVFQFTPLREGRLRAACPFAAHPSISIHAPPRGATGRWQRLREGHCLFQFTPLREGRRSR